MKPKMIIPMLVCKDAGAEIDFCKAAFGADELSRRVAKDGSVIHATLSINDTMIMVHNEATHLKSCAPLQDGSSSVVIYLYCEDVDETIKQSQNAGAKIQIPAEDAFWGDRTGRIIDPAGHVWNIASRIGEE